LKSVSQLKFLKNLGDKEWSKIMNYENRWNIVCLKKIENISKELIAKAYIHNMLINL